MNTILHDLGQALLMAFGMAWKTGWTLVLGFTISSVLQAAVPAEALQKRLGRGTPREIALATAAGAASSSCSYASAAIMRTLFKKGAALVNALAFLFASTNLVLELGIILLLFLGWQFMLGEWIGGVVLIVIMTVIVRLTLSKPLEKAAREHEETGKGHQHHMEPLQGDSLLARLKQPQAASRIAQNFVMEWSMLWKDLLIGFLIGGFLSAFVPTSFWQSLFLTDAPAWLQIPVNAVLGPVIAIFTFVCSVGNIPLAAVLFSSGASFGGVLAFIYADLIILPLIDAYRRYFGWKMALYIAGVMFVTMVAAGIVMDGAFSVLGLVPQTVPDIRTELTHFSIDYTFWLNIVFAIPAIWFFWIARNGAHAGHQDHDHMHHHETGGTGHHHH
ncbi:permease [Martelella sp. HB161492]|uniref:permease n=1 Tax=Martelella sp. HB161492 TaxID=2720726 RepID=UPI0015921042|nr:permease [Martelella sp. HB161492]